MNRYLRLLLSALPLLMVAGTSVVGESNSWGMVMYTHYPAGVYYGPFIQAAVEHTLGPDEAVRVVANDGQWLAVYPPSDNAQEPTKIRGYMKASELFPRPSEGDGDPPTSISYTLDVVVPLHPPANPSVTSPISGTSQWAPYQNSADAPHEPSRAEREPSRHNTESSLIPVIPSSYENDVDRLQRIAERKAKELEPLYEQKARELEPYYERAASEINWRPGMTEAEMMRQIERAAESVQPYVEQKAEEMIPHIERKADEMMREMEWE